MVKLTKIYTRTGDDGSTGLGDASRVAKTDPRVEAYGCVDEANAAIGMCVVRGRATGGEAALVELLESIQHDLFDVGADQCLPIGSDESPGAALRVEPAQTRRIEDAIDRFNDRLSALDSFVLPGGTELGALLHVARTSVRRAERASVALLADAPDATNPETVRYLNRLSDLLFVASRVANEDGAKDVKWLPGKNRPGASERGASE